MNEIAILRQLLPTDCQFGISSPTMGITLRRQGPWLFSISGAVFATFGFVERKNLHRR